MELASELMRRSLFVADLAKKRSRWTLGLGLLALVLFLLLEMRGTGEAPPSKYPAFLSNFDEQRTRCEISVRALHEADIDGREEYEKARLAGNRCIAFLVAEMDAPQPDVEQIRSLIKEANQTSASFYRWANVALFGNKAGIGPVGKFTDALKLLNEQDQTQSRTDKEKMERARFKTWDEIVAMPSSQTQSAQ
jgi:hypothetical protein